jgi:thiol-disulfide isomerase/thioredoxin
MPNRREKQRQRQTDVEQERAAQAGARRRERRIYVALASVLILLAAATAVIVSSRGSARGPTLTPVAAKPQPPPAPPSRTLPRGVRAALIANVGQANQILESTVSAKLAQLKGIPVVVNQWASWCTNCRAEFPYFQQAGRQQAGRVAFVGLDSQDERANAEAFLRKFPVIYPSLFDPSAREAQSLGGGQGWPTTIYFDATHNITDVHEGAYPNLESLEQDIARFT